MRPPPESSASEYFPFFTSGLNFGFLPLQYKVFRLLGRASRPLCADLSLGIQYFNRLRLLLAAPSDNRWRQRESFNAVEDRGEQVPRHRHLGQLKCDVFRVPSDLGSDLDELLS
jgi:hypothetical protein